MSKIKWQIDTSIAVGRYRIPCVPMLADGFNQGNGIKFNTKTKLILKNAVWPIYKLYRDFFIDGFVEWEIGSLIKRYLGKECTFLEVGCGDMSLSRYLPKDIWYNALDLQLSDFNILRTLRTNNKVNILIASATDIPVIESTVSLIVSSETFEHIPEIDKTIKEIYRILKPGGVLICSIPNNFSQKYVIKGAHPGHINNWTYDGFIKYMKSNKYEYVEGFMKGKWIWFPLWIAKNSYQLPITSKDEFFNSNFFYVFKVNKD